MNRSIIFIMAGCLLIMNCKALDKLLNQPPVIIRVMAVPKELSVNDTTLLSVEAMDPEGDYLFYKWECGLGGELIRSISDSALWVAPSRAGRYPITVTVIDENGSKASDQIVVNVRDETKPIVSIVQPVENQTIIGLGTYPIFVTVSYLWSIHSVDFFINNKLSYTDYSSPYQWLNWNVTGLSGRTTILVKAYDAKNLSNWGADSVHVNIEGVIPVPKRQ